jgi:hypothetical protein
VAIRLMRTPTWRRELAWPSRLTSGGRRPYRTEFPLGGSTLNGHLLGLTKGKTSPMPSYGALHPGLLPSPLSPLSARPHTTPARNW